MAVNYFGCVTSGIPLIRPIYIQYVRNEIARLVLDRSTPEALAAFEQAARNVSGCMECHVVTGEFDYFMLVRTRDSESFNRLHAEQLLYLPGVRQVRSLMVLKEILSTTQFPI